MTELKKRKDEKSHAPKPNTKDATEDVKPKFGPLPQFRTQKVWARGVMVLGVFAVVYFSGKSSKEITFAKHNERYDQIGLEVECSKEYEEEVTKFPGCVPKRCGRLVSDNLVSPSEAGALLSLANRGFSLAKPRGGVAILDLHSGAVSYDKGFVNVYKLEKASILFKESDFELYRVVKSKIQEAIAKYFGIDIHSLHLTHPTFFSRLTGVPPQTIHDEYWHTHVDKETYEAFHFTSLLYLNNYGHDFQGGRFLFVDADKTNRTVEPRAGRVSMFTSGSENTHFVERVRSGTRFAITVSFTCDEKHAITDPVLSQLQK